MHPMPEITATHVLAALSETAPPDVVIALSDDERVLVAPAATLRHWHGHLEATFVATHAEIAAALPPQQRRDLDAIDAVAATLTTHAATLLGAPATAAA